MCRRPDRILITILYMIRSPSLFAVYILLTGRTNTGAYKGKNRKENTYSKNKKRDMDIERG